jgi:hypothetical protein
MRQGANPWQDAKLMALRKSTGPATAGRISPALAAQMEARAQAKTTSSSLEARPSGHLRESIRSPLARYLCWHAAVDDRPGGRAESHITQLPELAQGRRFILAFRLTVGALLR